MKIQFLSLLILAAPCLATEYYVDGSATAGGDGTAGNPYNKIQQAAQVITAGDVCLIKGGVYPEIVRPSSSGSQDNPIIFRPATPDDTVIIKGSDPISADQWEHLSGGLFRTKINVNFGHENQVFLGEKMLVEARWPNTGDDLLKPALSMMDAGTTPDQIVDNQLPGLDYTGARVWIHASLYWSNWTTIVQQHSAGKLNIENIAPYSPPKQHVAAEGAEFFIYGCLPLLDAANEWYYDKFAGYLYVYRPDSALPGEPYYIKKRMQAFDLTGRSDIQLEDLYINGSNITTDAASARIVLDGLQIFYPYFSSEGNKYFGVQTSKGVIIKGTRCLVQNCEIAYSSGCGIVLDGNYNLVVNCYIHDTDYIGTYASNILLTGKGNVISHCTLSRTGRSLIDYGSMYKSLIQYCDMKYSGMLTRDTGLTYGNVIEGGNSEVRYNWMHDNLADHVVMGLYYDHGTQNILTHHNVIWGIRDNSFTINHYAYYHLVYNNTFSSSINGFRSTWGNMYGPDLHGCRFINNIFNQPSVTTATNHVWKNNLEEYKGVVSYKYLPEGSPGIDAAILVPGINDDFAGDGPDIGAYEYGGPDWKTGHDFDNPPVIDTVRIKAQFRNRLENPAFQHGDKKSPWKSIGYVTVQSGSKGQTTADTEPIRMGNGSISLGGGSELYQRVTTLDTSTWYEFAAFLRVDAGEQALIGVRNESGEEELGPVIGGNGPNWNRLILNFKTAPDQTAATAFIRRISTGSGKAYVDDCGLVYIPDSLMQMFTVSVRLEDKVSGEVIEGGTVSADGEDFITGADGTVDLSLRYGSHLIIGDGPLHLPSPAIPRDILSDILIVISLDVDYPDVSLTLLDRASGEPLSRAFVYYNEEVELSNTSGEATLPGIVPGILSYRIEHSDYFTQLDSLLVSKDTNLVIPLTAKLADVFFSVSDYAGAVSLANVRLNTITLPTGSNGKTYFFNRPARKKYGFSVEKEGYLPVSDSFYLDIDTTLEISLQLANPVVNELQSGIRIYPNPAGDKIFIVGLGGPAEVILMNAQGLVIRRYHFTELRPEISLSEIPPGVYFLRARGQRPLPFIHQ